jgi:hypothetical protein
MFKKILVLIAFFVVTIGVYAMSIRDVGKVCLFSAMSGVITLNGKPVANALLKRTVDLSKPKTDETRTDELGRFEFPAAFERTITKFLPQEFVAGQTIVVYYQGKEYELWSGVKRQPEENVESRGKPLVVQCELSTEKKHIRVNVGPISSLCTWDVEPDPKLEFDQLFDPGTDGDSESVGDTPAKKEGEQ